MFDYKQFRREMKRRGHEVHKHGDIITIRPKNNYIDYARGFLTAYEIIDGYEDDLRFYDWEHFNTWIYEVDYKIR